MSDATATTSVLTPAEIDAIDAWWRAANYLASAVAAPASANAASSPATAARYAVAAIGTATRCASSTSRLE